MAHFHDMDPERLLRFLESKRYRRHGENSGEVVYARQSERDPNVWVKVYTSVSARFGTRWRGSDAIRVCVVWDNGRKSFGIGKFPKVLRTTSDEAILLRVAARLESAHKRAVEWMNNPL